mmetsp:Transcript_31780/g.48784  ORF Transcript_31780/g.48784 Transcript_31780/m.48784 type:complete len:263 (-) Transcript_31780:41-829(-)
MASLGSSLNGGGDIGLRLAHTDGNLNEGVGDGLVGAELHELRSHGDAELLGHTSHLVEVGLGAESGRQSVERLLGIHEALELGAGVVVVNASFVLSLLLSSLLVGGGNSGVHISLHLGSLQSSFTHSQLFVLLEGRELKVLDRIGGDGHDGFAAGEDGLGPGITSLEGSSQLLSESVSHVGSGRSFHTNLEINRVRRNGHDGLTAGEDSLGPGVTSLEVGSKLSSELLSGVGSSSGLDTNLKVEIVRGNDGGSSSKEGSNNE